MTDADIDTATDTDSRRPLLGPAVLAALAALVLVTGIAAMRGTGTGDDSVPRMRLEPAAESDAATSGEAVTMGGAASCVETYSLNTLPRRQIAFEGTVEALDGDRVTFAVNRWFRGGDAASATLAGASALAGPTSAGPDMVLSPGARLLVAGDGGYAWACGFTQPYDVATAANWARSFAG